METFQKRQKEMKRLDRQRDKAAKRLAIKARKAAGIVEPEEADETLLDAPGDPDSADPGDPK